MMSDGLVYVSLGLDACFVGIPLDIGTSNRSGSRFGPRYLRCESPQRPVNQGTGVNPFLTHNVADIGDVWLNLYKWVGKVVVIVVVVVVVVVTLA